MDCHDYHGNFSLQEIDSYIDTSYRDWNRAAFYDLIERLHIEKSKRIDEMSRGTKSKAMLAIALAHSPSVLILDEVTSGLDPSVRREVLDLLQDKAHDEKTTILFSTHLPNDIEKIADSVCFLNKGRELFNLPVGQLQGLFFIMNTLAVSTLTLDFQYKWEVTVRSLPLNVRQVIGSKYLFVLLMMLVSLIAVQRLRQYCSWRSAFHGRQVFWQSLELPFFSP